MMNEPVPAVSVEHVSILFTDIVGFTRICGECDPDDITTMLNKLYLEFDVLCEKYRSYKVYVVDAILYTSVNLCPNFPY